MNLRILKKLSKRAAPLLPLLGDHRDQFRAKPHDSYTSTFVGARKHWERMGVKHRKKLDPGDENERGRRYYLCRKGYVVVMSNCYIHPRKGTVMVGVVSGGETPEWDEETAWDSLKEIVWWTFVDIDEDGEKVTPTRRLRTPADYFKAANDIVREAA